PDFAREYERLERAGLGVESLPIQDMAFLIVRSAVMTGSPFLMMKDACNRHFHTDTRGAALATSNLCTEIVQRATPGENGVCNLASVNLPACLAGGAFDFAALRRAEPSGRPGDISASWCWRLQSSGPSSTAGTSRSSARIASPDATGCT
ncbi:hypothetical protein EG861_14065, partial [Enterococcus faecalis]